MLLDDRRQLGFQPAQPGVVLRDVRRIDCQALTEPRQKCLESVELSVHLRGNGLGRAQHAALGRQMILPPLIPQQAAEQCRERKHGRQRQAQEPWKDSAKHRCVSIESAHPMV
jgi:hypothetical protein